jgi:hypothetical protein
MGKKITYENNSFFPKSDQVRQYNDWYFEELMIALLIIKEENSSKTNGKIELIKKLKSDTDFGLKDSKDFYDILESVGIINEKEGIIEDYIYDINSIRDLHYIIINNMNAKLFSRNKKIKILTNKIKNGLA